MAAAKTTTLTFRIEPALKEGLRAAAVQEHRSIANMIEVMIRDYCGRNGVTVPTTSALERASEHNVNKNREPGSPRAKLK